MIFNIIGGSSNDWEDVTNSLTWYENDDGVITEKLAIKNGDLLCIYATLDCSNGGAAAVIIPSEDLMPRYHLDETFPSMTIYDLNENNYRAIISANPFYDDIDGLGNPGFEISYENFDNVCAYIFYECQ